MLPSEIKWKGVYLHALSGNFIYLKKTMKRMNPERTLIYTCIQTGRHILTYISTNKTNKCKHIQNVRINLKV